MVSLDYPSWAFCEDAPTSHLSSPGFEPLGHKRALDVTQPRPGMQTCHPKGSPQQPKAVSQRQYRGREGELFDELRTSIASLTNQEPDTRQEILTQASRLLMSLRSENARIRQQLAGNVHHFGNRSSPSSHSSLSIHMPELDYFMGLNNSGQHPYHRFGTTSHYSNNSQLPYPRSGTTKHYPSNGGYLQLL
ncbi:hypothetical protein SCLCIDRAFT_554104 [Scleroderma citrinum Foug A]|uniref:BHLH domain-containing protein n=1 Tax=Scleroderma citrinum Foug A TaxID=1036808 RepID=A0A0C2YRV1_9AGAM|nr:hypothetical protein SCLCIDRAFT_554104 [Scleroderma citrinum Foug A]